jgi:hypothetical protein
MAVQGIGQDIVNLFLIVPLLLFTLFLVTKGNRIAFNLYGGILFYILYSFVIYSLGVHFNQMFLLYCLILGLSLYSFIIFIYNLTKTDIQKWYSDKVPLRSTSYFLMIIAILFYLLWLKEVVPAIVGGTTPRTVSDYQLLVNPVHVIDIAIALPGLIITAYLLRKKHQLGLIFAPVALVFIILLTIALIGMVIMLNLRNISDDSSLMYIFIFLSVISSLFLFQFLKHLRGESHSQ